mmetsp:Transcript_10074/g.22643  ORF Transcript_10074/g.22643 Transcript_10074/m.22643 type:complete len:586 (+) Transcript_10074:142-1899(+)
MLCFEGCLGFLNRAIPATQSEAIAASAARSDRPTASLPSNCLIQSACRPIQRSSTDDLYTENGRIRGVSAGCSDSSLNGTGDLLPSGRFAAAAVAASLAICLLAPRLGATSGFEVTLSGLVAINSAVLVAMLLRDSVRRANGSREGSVGGSKVDRTPRKWRREAHPGPKDDDADKDQSGWQSFIQELEVKIGPLQTHSEHEVDARELLRMVVSITDKCREVDTSRGQIVGDLNIACIHTEERRKIWTAQSPDSPVLFACSEVLLTTAQPTWKVLQSFYNVEERMTWDSQSFETYEVLRPAAYQPDSGALGDLIYCVIALPMGFKSRDMVQERFVLPLPDHSGGCAILCRSCSDSTATRAGRPPATRDPVRAVTVLSGYIIVPHAGGGVLLTACTQTDMKSLAPQWVQKLATKVVKQKMLEGFARLERYCNGEEDFAQQGVSPRFRRKVSELVQRIKRSESSEERTPRRMDGWKESVHQLWRRQPICGRRSQARGNHSSPADQQDAFHFRRSSAWIGFLQERVQQLRERRHTASWTEWTEPTWRRPWKRSSRASSDSEGWGDPLADSYQSPAELHSEVQTTAQQTG